MYYTNNAREISMIVGNHFSKVRNLYEDIDEWSASEECATIACLVCHLVETVNISPENATDIICDSVIHNGFRNIENHAWDEYVRGFLAGEILGISTEKNLKLLEKAEELWDGDHTGKYGYFQEVLEEVKKEEFV